MVVIPFVSTRPGATAGPPNSPNQDEEFLGSIDPVHVLRRVRLGEAAALRLGERRAVIAHAACIRERMKFVVPLTMPVMDVRAEA